MAAKQTDSENSTVVAGFPTKFVCLEGDKCKKHNVLIGIHLDKQEWEDFCNQHVADTGLCTAWVQIIKGRLGKRKYDRMKEHLFKECKDYLWSESFDEFNLWNDILNKKVLW